MGAFDILSPEIHQRASAIASGVEKYCAMKGLPYHSRGYSFVRLVSMAGEIASTKEYHLAIGVLRSGAPLAVLMELLGVKTAFIEPNRGSGHEPVWWQRQPNFKPTQRVIVCEDDCKTGKTLAIVAHQVIPHVQRADLVMCAETIPVQEVATTTVCKVNGFRFLVTADKLPGGHALKHIERVENALKRIGIST